MLKPTLAIGGLLLLSAQANASYCSGYISEIFTSSDRVNYRVRLSNIPYTSYEVSPENTICQLPRK
ncbi:hypothetical protein [Pleionea sp. CnH1-48]|uniref:hypothetical protein n=1 Tax=Pleionea sp. CnH1-48 TaxID=2954494 RepID=UPI0020982539|nr:hypothetical protein [Pleionea sp. CnH1-48]MCO7226185.1 hypothetical protein [Pleionea sp. CnH1-48]